MSHDDDTCPHLVVLGRLEAENGILMREVVKQMDENARLKAEVAIQNKRINRRDMDVGQLYCENARLKAEVERLTKAVMHSPAAQLKLKELEGKTTYEEINGKIPPCIDKYEAK